MNITDLLNAGVITLVFSFAVIPDVIGGTSEENDALIAAWPHGKFIGVRCGT